VGADGPRAHERRERRHRGQSAAPYGALLMADFLLSPDAQGILEKFYDGSAAKNQPFKKWRPERGLTTDQYEKELLRWEKLLNAITRK
jgi:hypothetical protein